MLARISDASKSADISKRIDAKFDNNDDQTLTMSERAFGLSFLGGFVALLSAFGLGSLVILLIMALVLANTIAMNARERTHEYGVLRAIGFPPGHIAGVIIRETPPVGAARGLPRIGVGELLINRMVGPALAENAGGLLANLATPGWLLGLGLGAAGVLG